MCRATNRLGTAEAAATLHVEEDDEGRVSSLLPRVAAAAASTTRRPQLQQQQQQGILTFLVRPHDLVAPQGSTVQLPCRAYATSSLDVTWNKDGRDFSRENTLSGSVVILSGLEISSDFYDIVSVNIFLSRQSNRLKKVNVHERVVKDFQA